MNTIHVEKKRPPAKMIEAVCRKRLDIPLALVKSMLGYNVITVGQLSSVTGIPATKIAPMSVPKDNPNARYKISLTRIYPFPEFEDGESKPGKLFILRDEECDRLIMESNQR